MPRDYPAPLIMWTWQDDQVEDHRRLDAAIADIAAHGFSGILAMLRGCRYAISDPLVIDAARHAATRAHEHDLAFWFALDPRLDQGRLVALPGGGATYALAERRDDVLRTETPVAADGRYRVRLEYGHPRPQHMLSQVAATFEPDAVAAAVAYRKAGDGTVVAESVRDVSGGARLFVQRERRYVEIFGSVSPVSGSGWWVLALARCTSTYPDLGNEAVIEAICDLYRTYGDAGVELDGVFWDEIGHLSGFGTDGTRLPWGPAVHDAFARRHGGPLAAALPYLLLDDDAGRAGDVRRDYYAALQDVIIDAQVRSWDQARAVWGEDVDSGIHQTWHQDADDLPHGSGDWWRGSVALSGGFTDVGDAERAGEPDHLDEVISMTVIAAALARHHRFPRAFCNMWGVEYGPEIVDWWTRLLGAFGVTWLAHTYGPTSYIDHDTGWGPGYPDHPTWDHITAANQAAARVRQLTGAALPEVDVAVVYPIGAMARLGNAAANAVARGAQRTIAELVRHGIAVDVISPDLLAAGSVREGALWLDTTRGVQRYGAVVCPLPDALQPGEADVLERLRAAGVPTPVGIEPLGSVPPGLPRLIDAPAGTLATMFRRPDAAMTIVITPLLPETSADGEVRAGELRIDVSGLRGIAAVVFDGDGNAVERWVSDGTVGDQLDTAVSP